MTEEGPVYNVNDSMPKSTLVLSVLQHILAMAVYMSYPVIIVNAMNGDSRMSIFLISVTLFGCGVATILQAFRKTGTGFFLPMIPNSTYLPASLLAVSTGGLPLLYSMLVISGFLEMILSRFTRFFKIIFPEEIVGVVLFLLGIAIIPFAFPLFFGSTNSSPLDPACTAVGVITLISMIACSLIPKQFFKFYSILIGLVIGFVSAILLGVFPLETFATISSVAPFAIPNPFEFVSFSFDAGLLIPFVIAIICIMLKTSGNISLMSAYTKAGDRNTQKHGLLAEGVGVALTGAIGGIGIGSSSSSVGLAIGTGIASRKIGLGVGLVMIFAAFFPCVGWFFDILPKPVLGAVLLYAVTFVMISGIQSISSRLLDIRRTFVVILPILTGVSSAVCPYLYTGLPETLQLFFTSPLTAGSVTAIILGLCFKIGIPSHKSLALPGDVHGFTLECGRLWTLDKTQVVRISHNLEPYLCGAAELELTLHSNHSMLRAEISYEKEPSEVKNQMALTANVSGKKAVYEYLLQ
ncbi:MAG TPA: purine/pyrimidine permease [Methanocorpusculum sp.]|nr:purine/pyrimidine permease [Methanocorpusculum sp.]